MKAILFFALYLALAGCASGDKKAAPQAEKAAPQITPSLPVFTDTLKKVSNTLPTAVDSALHLYDMFAPNDSTGADSAASTLMAFIKDVVEKQNNRFQNDSTDYYPLLDPANNSLSDKQKAFSSELHKAKLKLASDGEGGVYAVPAYETILPTVKERTTMAVDNYLDLSAKEDTSSALLDAGLAIDMEELVDRLVQSEQLMTQKLPKRFAADVAQLNRFYTNALIQGSDNSPAIDHNTNTLTQDFEKGYQYLLAKYPSSKAAARINVWMAVAKSGDKKKIDDYLKLLNQE